MSIVHRTRNDDSLTKSELKCHINNRCIKFDVEIKTGYI